MHHFLIVLWILFDSETHDAIERRVNEDQRAILIQALKDLVLIGLQEPQESFFLFFYSLNCWLIVSWFSRHSLSRSRSISWSM